MYLIDSISFWRTIVDTIHSIISEITQPLSLYYSWPHERNMKHPFFFAWLSWCWRYARTYITFLQHQDIKLKVAVKTCNEFNLSYFNIQTFYSAASSFVISIHELCFQFLSVNSMSKVLLERTKNRVMCHVISQHCVQMWPEICE